MKILVSGSSGLIGSALCSYLETQGHEVYKLVRNKGSDSKNIYWNPANGELNPNQLSGFDAIINLAGENIAQHWTEKKKKQITDSRVNSTQLLANAIAILPKPPEVFICASAIGYYGSCGSEIITEESAKGTGFLADLCSSWEDACLPVSKKGIRTVNARLGVVLTPKGGALAKMLPPFLFGMGGILGNGQQYISWISLDDVVKAIYFAITNTTIQGPINCVAPNPVTNKEFTKALGAMLSRPTIFPVPAFVITLLFGEMGEQMLLSGAKILPKKLEAAGFQFQHLQINDALSHVLKNK